jgi:hypothetical protein
MNLKTPLRFLAFLASFSPLRAADIEISQPLTLSESNSLWWVRTNLIAKDQKQWDWKLDEAKWGTPSGEQGGQYNWDWKIDDAQWRAAVAEKGEGKKQECTFDLWIPEGAPVVKGMVVMSGHGSGSALYKNPQLRQIARELQLGLLKFIGDPVQRGFWPKSLLAERLKAMGLEAGHPEIEHGLSVRALQWNRFFRHLPCHGGRPGLGLGVHAPRRHFPGLSTGRRPGARDGDFW